MKEYQTHLYMICYPNVALVASQLSAEEFGYRYSFGSSSYYDGKLIYAEIDETYRHPFFQIEESLKDLHPHRDGRPKATKYIASYRILEHVDIDAIKTIYLVNGDGSSFQLTEAEYQEEASPNSLRVFAEITPLRMLALSKFNFREYADWITDPANPLSVPQVLYTQITLNIDEFLKEFDFNPFMPPPLPGVHPSKLRDAIVELRNKHKKFVKGLTLDTSFKKESYRSIRHGFVFASQNKRKFFPMPALSEIEKANLKFWRSM